jgi:hypothetical protein
VAKARADGEAQPEAAIRSIGVRRTARRYRNRE